MLKDSVPPLVAAGLGGLLGGVILGGLTLVFFRVINPNRDRGHTKKKDW